MRFWSKISFLVLSSVACTGNFSTQKRALTASATCEDASCDSEETSSTSTEVAPESGTGSALLLSNHVTDQTTGTVRVTCDNANFYAVTSSSGAGSPSSFRSCTPGQSVEETFNLAVGDNEVRVWLKATESGPVKGLAKIPVFLGIKEITTPNEITAVYYAEYVVGLSNGNYAVTNSRTDDFVNSGGAVQLFSGRTHELIATIKGDEGDMLGYNGLKDLGNGYFLIFSQSDDNGGLNAAGSVMMVNSSTGVVFKTIYGDHAGDQFGRGGATVLSNGNFVVISPYDYDGVTTGLGSVSLYNGTTGALIGKVMGTYASDNIGDAGVVELGNGNYVTGSKAADTATLAGAGAAILIDGVTGLEIGRISGDQANNNIAGEGFVALSNNHVVIHSKYDDTASVTNAGSVILMNGTDASEIGKVEGTAASDQFGFSKVVELTNGNYVFAAIYDNANDRGAVVLVDGSTGAEINRISGDTNDDDFGSGGLIALSTGHYAFANPQDDDGMVDNGSVILANGTTGSEIARISGDQVGNLFGSELLALANGNFVIRSLKDDTATLTNNGSVVLANGTTGAEIGREVGSLSFSQLGSGEMIELANGDYAVASPRYDVSGALPNAGMVMIFNGSTGLERSRLSGSVANGLFGLGGMTQIADNQLTILSTSLNGGQFIIYDVAAGQTTHSIEGDSVTYQVSMTADPIKSSSYPFAILPNSSMPGAGQANAGGFYIVPLD